MRAAGFVGSCTVTRRCERAFDSLGHAGDRILELARVWILGDKETFTLTLSP
jgi:hypothetical protein